MRVLIVEDSEDDNALLVRELEKNGLVFGHRRVENEAGLREALAEERWDAVITDYGLPGTNGAAILRILREHSFAGPVLAVSGSLSEEQLVEAMRGGAHDFIQKNRLARLAPALCRELAEAAEREARKSAELSLGQTEERLRAVLQNMPVLLVAFGEKGEILVWNRECERVTGFAPSEIVGQSSATERLFPDPAHRRRVLEEWTGSDREYRGWELAITGKDHLVHTICWSSVARSFPIPGWAGWAVGIDVSQRLRMEMDLREANRMKDEFLATVSHELRTPLTAILGWIHLLRAHKLDAAMSERALEVVDRNAKVQAQLIADILDVSRIVTGKFRLEPRAIDLARVIEASIDAVRPATDAKRIRLAVETDPHMGAVVADPDRLQQVVWNLLSNAAKFTSEGGRVTLRVVRKEGRIELSVSDSGAGISPDLLPHVFERFRQGDSSSTRLHGGLGLGLAIVRHIVELHGGTVRAESPGTGRGATFFVSLPLRAAEMKASLAAGAAEAQEPGLDGITVLVVDDDPDTLDLVATVLRQRGAIVATAAGTDEALQRVASRRPDILLSDLAMPGDDGFDLIRRVRAMPAGHQIRAAALSAYARTEDRLKALWAGFETHIPKPVQPSELAAVVASLAGRIGGPAAMGTDRRGDR